MAVTRIDCIGCCSSLVIIRKRSTHTPWLHFDVSISSVMRCQEPGFIIVPGRREHCTEFVFHSTALIIKSVSPSFDITTELSSPLLPYLRSPNLIIFFDNSQLGRDISSVSLSNLSTAIALAVINVVVRRPYPAKYHNAYSAAVRNRIFLSLSSRLVVSARVPRYSSNRLFREATGAIAQALKRY